MSNSTTALSNKAETQIESTPPTTTRTQAYVALTKLRISVMVLFTFAVAAVLIGQCGGRWCRPRLDGGRTRGHVDDRVQWKRDEYVP